MSDSLTTYQSGPYNLKPKDRRDALQKLIEIGGFDSETWFWLRSQFEQPEREAQPASHTFNQRGKTNEPH